MEVVWQKGEATVQDIQEEFVRRRKPLAQPSIRTMLAILQEKGYVGRRQEGKGFIYAAALPRREAEKRILRDIVARAFRGSAAGLVAALLDTRMVSSKDIDKIKEMIDKRESEGAE